MANLDPHRLVFVDECGANTAMTRTYGRAPVGQRVFATTPGRWESITLPAIRRALVKLLAPVSRHGCTYCRPWLARGKLELTE